MKVATHRLRLYLLSGLALMLVAAGPSLAQPAQPAPEKADDAYAEALPIIGEAERVVIKPQRIILEARVDTGAQTSSLGVDKLDEFERDGTPWVRFVVENPKDGEPVHFSLPIARIAKIKRHGGEAQRRPVVEMRVVLGPIDQKREFTLTDRSDFEYPVLLGRNYLLDAAVVDVSRKFSVKPALEAK